MKAHNNNNKKTAIKERRPLEMKPGVLIILNRRKLFSHFFDGINHLFRRRQFEIARKEERCGYLKSGMSSLKKE